jgi:hypothetical protein
VSSPRKEGLQLFQLRKPLFPICQAQHAFSPDAGCFGLKETQRTRLTLPPLKSAVHRKFSRVDEPERMNFCYSIAESWQLDSNSRMRTPLAVGCVFGAALNPDNGT